MSCSRLGLLAALIISPNSTPLGHASSHFLQNTQVSIPELVSAPETTAAILPRGECTSDLVALYVGHASKQNPQCTHFKESCCASLRSTKLLSLPGLCV